MTPAVATQASARLRELFKSLENRDRFRETAAAWVAGEAASFDGVWGSSCALLSAALVERASDQPLVIVCPRDAEVDEFVADLSLFSDAQPLKFPAWEGAPGEQRVQDEIYGERLRTLKRLHRFSGATSRRTKGETPRAPVVVTSIQALLQPVPTRNEIAGNTRELKVGERLDVSDFLRWLAQQRFHATSAVELPGEFSHRGGIIDLFAPDWDQPVRMELFDDEIESLRRFDISSQRSLESLDTIEITVLRAISEESQLENDSTEESTESSDEADAASDSDEPKLRKVTASNETVVRGHFVDYLPSSSRFMMLEPQQVHDHGSQYLQRVDRADRVFGLPETMASLTKYSIASVSAMLGGEEKNHCPLGFESVEHFSGDFAKVREELDRVGTGQEVIIVAQTQAEIKRLGEIFATTQLATAGQLHYALGSLRTGFRMTREKIAIVTGGELFHRHEVRRAARRHLGKAIDSFLDLNPGDLVVHLSHGIGRYRGLKLIDKDGHVLEHLELEFAEGTKIFVPASKIDLVQKYIGGTKSQPKLAKIGGQLWQKQKKAAEAAVIDMAAELLELQAARSSRPGIEFVADSDWQHAFDASFPYHETPDQLTALEAIKGDMTRARPMDRLLCGDVGFGKTEVAMRAAFRAVDNGYQVAVLVPTTILAEQHYHTFRERMAEFPFDIGRLSRFCPRDEEKEILKGLANGKVDIAIGTHRICSSDVKFHNLGLVIIDEEQRFGVEVKERLKTLRTTVDVLTMSATPIPRTLHMSLVGVRDISNLETPPEDRMAVETKVTRFNNDLIRHAVLRELNRGGQIYFVHNRVNDIEVLAQKLKYIVPEASVRIGHGQMPEDELEGVMVDFIAGKFDLLLATTIVESGLDIPNANTIFIDEAERYGLADLHQLRGRVGRYKHRAYCYLLIDQHKHLTPNAAKRLRAIEEFSEMGAGFAISMRDLEIRGAGNLLGSQQSGHIATVGYELYCQLLENAVRNMKHMPPKRKIDVDLDLPGRAFLPDDYIPDLRLKIDMYRRLSRVESIQQLKELRAEFEDRFGPLPDTVKQMLILAELKIDAAVWQVAGVRVDGKYMVFDYAHRGRIEQLSRLRKGKLRVVDDKSAYITIPEQFSQPDGLLQLAKSVLRPN